MKYRLTKKDLLSVLIGWSKFIKRKVRLIACGGTAMTLLDVKVSTKDIDFIVSNDKEYAYLTGILKDIGYKNEGGFRWKREKEFFDIDLFAGKYIHTTELLESPLEEKNHIFLQNIGRLYLGILNYYDLISSKLLRGSSVDFEDCLMLVKFKGKEINKNLLIKRYNELISYDISENRVKGYLESFIARWEKEVS